MKPRVGETRRAEEIGKGGTHQYVYLVCSGCGKGRWVQVNGTRRSSFTGLCNSCWAAKAVQGENFKKARTRRGKAHPNWRGRGHRTSRGYIAIPLDPEDFFYPMAGYRGYVFEHRLVVAKKLGRCLHRWEIVHHRNAIKDDNRWENLQLTSEGGHNPITVLQNEIGRLRARVTLLEANNVLLEARLAVFEEIKGDR